MKISFPCGGSLILTYQLSNHILSYLEKGKVKRRLRLLKKIGEIYLMFWFEKNTGLIL